MVDRSAKLHVSKCVVCGDEFMAHRQDIRRGYGKYCSDGCERAGRAARAADPTRVAIRFWKKVNKNGPCRYGLDPCWIWEAAMFTKAGYGTFVFCGDRAGAHRVAWFLHHGVWPTLQILHRCDVRNCVNPAHLFEGTHQDNMDDMADKGRAGPAGCGETRVKTLSKFSGRSKLTPDQVREIRATFVPGKDTFTEFGRRYGVTYRTISLVVERKIWKEVG